MNDIVIVAILSLAGTGIGTFGGIITANKLTNYRISQLEKKVDKHNTVIERTFALESAYKVMDFELKDIKDAQKEIEEKIETRCEDGSQERKNSR